MANPVKVNVPADTWTKVADNVVSGLITIKQWQASRYYQTYRVTGDPAPTGDQSEDTSTVTTSREINIAAVEAIDVYLFCDGVAGEVVVSL
jgi:hypothetical protein